MKTELLLLSKLPITNKIAIELEFDSSNNKFKIKNFAVSSGEKTVDEAIARAIERALGINLKFNIGAFANGSSNPILIIRL